MDDMALLVSFDEIIIQTDDLIASCERQAANLRNIKRTERSDYVTGQLRYWSNAASGITWLLSILSQKYGVKLDERRKAIQQHRADIIDGSRAEDGLGTSPREIGNGSTEDNRG